jgi:hypothetical protein
MSGSHPEMVVREIRGEKKLGFKGLEAIEHNNDSDTDSLEEISKNTRRF